MGSRLATISQDGTAKVWDSATGQVLATLPTNLTDNLQGPGIAMTPDGARLLTIGGGNIATLWDITRGTVMFTLKGHTATVTSVAFSPDGQSLATSSVNRTIKIWKLPKKGEQAAPPLTLYRHTGTVYFVPD
jgi:WD40 repeat protein